MTPVVAIVGRANVGKSSLFNRLVGQRQAITHQTAGTTRDPNYGKVAWGGQELLLVDTAGLHKSDDQLDIKVQDQISEVAAAANALIVVVDAAVMITSEDRQAARLALKTGKPVLLALNKIDTASGQDMSEFVRLGIPTIIETSAIHGRGTGDLLDALIKLIPKHAPAEGEIAPFTTLALLGRPNVGKSSILNALVGKQQAIVSETAGTTRDTGVAELKYHGQTIQLLDTAGLRRRGKIEPGVEKYSSLRTLAAITRSDIAAVVIDAGELSVAGDQHIAGMVTDAGKGLILVVNKWDSVEDKDDKTQARYVRKLMRDFAFASWAPLLFTSATQGLNITKLFELTTEIAERRNTQITTGQLNSLIEKLVGKQPPAGSKGRQPKINYATQIGTNPPTFAIFASYPELIHFSYKRYLENGLRAAHDFSGTPIKLVFRDKRTAK